jgi:hypothetical protein
LIEGYSPSDEECFQSTGRLSRDQNGMGILITPTMAQYCNLRFELPHIQERSKFMRFFEAYTGMSTPVISL